MIKGIIFDLDGVYFINGKENFIKNISSKFKVDIELVKDVFLRSKEMQEYKEGKISGDEFWNYAINKWKIKSTPNNILKIMQDGYEINKSTIKLMKELGKSIKFIICSNNFRERVRILDEKFSFLKNFDYAIFSYDYGIRKPKLLEKVQGVTKLNPNEILVLDDSKENIDGAKKLGFLTILCEDASKIEEYLKKFGI